MNRKEFDSLKFGNKTVVVGIMFSTFQEKTLEIDMSQYITSMIFYKFDDV